MSKKKETTKSKKRYFLAEDNDLGFDLFTPFGSEMEEFNSLDEIKKYLKGEYVEDGDKFDIFEVSKKYVAKVNINVDIDIK